MNPRSRATRARTGPWALSATVVRKKKSSSAASDSCGDVADGLIIGTDAGPVSSSAMRREAALEFGPTMACTPSSSSNPPRRLDADAEVAGRIAGRALHRLTEHAARLVDVRNGQLESPLSFCGADRRSRVVEQQAKLQRGLIGRGVAGQRARRDERRQSERPEPPVWTRASAHRFAVPPRRTSPVALVSGAL